MNKHVPTESLVTPPFEHGKTYRTAGGHTMKVKLVGDHGPELFGKEQDPFGNRTTASLVTVHYNPDGWPKGGGWSAYQLLPGAIEDEKATFQPGKSYRTRGGDVVKIVRRTKSFSYPLQGEHHNQCWTLDGRYWTEAKHECSADLMSGAVEDEPVEVERPETITLAERVGKIEREMPRHEAIVGMQQQINSLFKLCESQQKQLDEPSVVVSDLRQLHSRLNRQAERIEDQTKHQVELYKRIESLEKVSELRTNLHIEVTKRIAALEMLEEASVTSNRNYAHDEGARRRIGSVEKDLSERLDRMAIEISGKANGGFAEDHLKRIKALESVVLFIKPDLSKVAPNHPDVIACGNPECGQCYSPKRTIKGGWINVFGGRQLSGIFSNQYDAINNGNYHAKGGMGAPIACIQIPDIQEGEGL